MVAAAILSITIKVAEVMLTNVVPIELCQALPAFAKSSITKHNRQYNVNNTQQDNAGYIPKALWDQLPPHAKHYLWIPTS